LAINDVAGCCALLRFLLRVKCLAINDVADVAGFATSYAIAVGADAKTSRRQDARNPLSAILKPFAFVIGRFPGRMPRMSRFMPRRAFLQTTALAATAVAAGAGPALAGNPSWVVGCFNRPWMQRFGAQVQPLETPQPGRVLKICCLEWLFQRKISF
jgi:hypothetical protein